MCTAVVLFVVYVSLSMVSRGRGYDGFWRSDLPSALWLRRCCLWLSVIPPVGIASSLVSPWPSFVFAFFFLLKHSHHIKTPTTAASANAPPAALPAIAATGGPSSDFGDVNGEGASDDGTLAAVTPGSSVEVDVDRVDVLEALNTVVDPPVAWYALSRSSRFRIAASRSPSGHPD